MSSALAGTARAVLEPLLAVLFPSRCPACSGFLAQPSRGPLCPGCWEALPRFSAPLCRCGLPAARGERCGRCRRGLQPWSAGFALGPYEGGLRTLVHELKYHGRRRVAERLAQLLCEDAQARALLSRDVLLVPVPLHPRRRRERGFNQSELLVRALVRRLDLAWSPACLVRRQDTRPQTGLSAAQRRANVRSAFVVRRQAQLCDRVVVLVDDVVTTGATASACARALRAAGARDVRLLALARVA